MLPEAPATFSTTIVVCNSAAMRSDRIRASVSVGPPAANGTTRVIGRDGNGWALAGAVHAALPIKAHTTITRPRDPAHSPRISLSHLFLPPACCQRVEAGVNAAGRAEASRNLAERLSCRPPWRQIGGTVGRRRDVH